MSTRVTKFELQQQLAAALARATAAETALSQRDADVARLKAALERLEERRRIEGASYVKKLRALRGDAPQPTPARPDWATLARRYCAELGVRSVSREELRAYAAALMGRGA